jgi:uncharacterized protein (DUF2235 family)
METGTQAVGRRQLVVLCDGTNNNLTGKRSDTNVVKLSALFAADPHPQRIVFYDPGVGNSGELPGATWWDKLRRELGRVNGLAFGRGVYENMLECYLFLMRHYRPGDEIFIFGFSRGAFTARSVAGLVNQFGILRPHMESMLPNLLHVYFADRKGPKNKARFDAIAEQVSLHFAEGAAREVDIQFVGVWDTVASVGLPPFHAKFTALPTLAGKKFVHVRQALALDEHRLQFKPRLYAEDNGSFKTKSGREGTVEQLWFPGSHCDVGGGYEVKDCELSDTALAWLVSEAVQRGGLWLAADGRPLGAEAEVQARLHAKHAAPLPGRTPRVRSQLRESAVWAVTGMCVRDTDRVVMDDGPPHAVRTDEHPSVESLKLNAGQHGPWVGAWPPALVWIAAALIPLYVLALGQLLDGAPQTQTLWGDLVIAWQSMGGYLAANEAFQRWQLTGWVSKAWPLSLLSDPWAIASWFAVDKGSLVPGEFKSPRWALFWDIGFIACYAIVLSWAAACSFGVIAGLRRLGHATPPWLNALGRALPVMVFCDLGENLMTWLALTAGQHEVVMLAIATHVAAAALSVGKFAGLVGVLVLIGVGVAGFRVAKIGKPPTATGMTGSPGLKA